MHKLQEIALTRTQQQLREETSKRRYLDQNNDIWHGCKGCNGAIRTKETKVTLQTNAFESIKTDFLTPLCSPHWIQLRMRWRILLHIFMLVLHVNPRVFLRQKSNSTTGFRERNKVV